MTTSDPVSLPAGELLIFVLAVAQVVAGVSWLVVRSRRRRRPE